MHSTVRNQNRYTPSALSFLLQASYMAHVKMTPAFEDAAAHFSGVDIVEDDNDLTTPVAGCRSFKLTERGVKFLEMLTATPIPVLRYIDPREK